MEITESKVRALVEEVLMKHLSEYKKDLSPPKDSGVFDNLDEAVLSARRSFNLYQNYSIKQRDKIIENIRRLCTEHVEIISKMAVEETGLGNYNDKIKKNLLVINKTPGTEDLQSKSITGDDGVSIIERGPFGVIGAITPCTNPSETIINNGIGIIAGGNSVVFCPHPLARKTSIYTVNLINKAVIEAGGPENLFTILKNPSIEQAQNLMTHKGIDLLVVTGGPDVVKKALTSGKKVVAGGPGNPPVVVDETADIVQAGRDIVLGASLDNNIVCIDEKEVFVVESVADRLFEEMQKNGAYKISSHNLRKLEQLVLIENRGGRKHSVINKKWVGKDAKVILNEIGINTECKLIICDVDENHPFVWSELLMPILAVVRVKNVEEAINLAYEAEHGFGHTASIFSKNIDNITKMAKKMNTSIFVVNGPNYSGLGLGGEGYTSFTIASPSGEGLTTAKNFTRERRATFVKSIKLV
jgi:propionaldehyde dehydrogenase